MGINSDGDREALKKVMEKENINWRSWWNGGSTNGPIAARWNVDSWPTVYVLDVKGVIRYKRVPRGVQIDEAVDTLLAELEKKDES